MLEKVFDFDNIMTASRFATGTAFVTLGTSMTWRALAGTVHDRTTYAFKMRFACLAGIFVMLGVERYWWTGLSMLRFADLHAAEQAMSAWSNITVVPAMLETLFVAVYFSTLIREDLPRWQAAAISGAALMMTWSVGLLMGLSNV